MNPVGETLVHLAAVAAAISTFSLPMWNYGARAQTRPIKIVVPYATGGAVDLMDRVLAEQIGRARGVTVVVEDRPGAGSVIGTEAVARAVPDGGTLLTVAPDLVIAPHLRKVNYNPLRASSRFATLSAHRL
jgi:tripartite-type tricarboxylate transporter receptor subunit TctC